MKTLQKRYQRKQLDSENAPYTDSAPSIGGKTGFPAAKPNTLRTLLFCGALAPCACEEAPLQL